jgi:hypothetical protein
MVLSQTETFVTVKADGKSAHIEATADLWPEPGFRSA